MWLGKVFHTWFSLRESNLQIPKGFRWPLWSAEQQAQGKRRECASNRFSLIWKPAICAFGVNWLPYSMGGWIANVRICESAYQQTPACRWLQAEKCILIRDYSLRLFSGSWILFVGGRIEPRALCVLSICFATEPNTPSLLLVSDMNTGIT